MNQIKLTGTLVFAPEVKVSSSGKSWLGNKLAVKRGSTKETDYIPFKAFGENADSIANMSKGAEVSIEGSMQSGNYEKDGQKVYTLDMVVFRVNA